MNDSKLLSAAIANRTEHRAGNMLTAKRARERAQRDVRGIRALMLRLRSMRVCRKCAACCFRPAPFRAPPRRFRSGNEIDNCFARIIAST